MGLLRIWTRKLFVFALHFCEGSVCKGLADFISCLCPAVARLLFFKAGAEVAKPFSSEKINRTAGRKEVTQLGPEQPVPHLTSSLVVILPCYSQQLCHVGKSTWDYLKGSLLKSSMESVLGVENKRPFHVVTPVLQSMALSQAAGTKVYMKLENVQPSGSFKIRGIGYFCQQVARDGCQHLVCSSGGNAGLAAAYVANKLGIPITVVVPRSTSQLTVKRLEEQGAEVEVFGQKALDCFQKKTLQGRLEISAATVTSTEVFLSCFVLCEQWQAWDEANERAMALAEADGWINVHPFDHPLVWKGHATLVQELRDSLNAKPGAIVLAVGGGGLLSGVVSGLQEVGWLDVPIVAVETRGADSFNQAIKAGHLVTLPEITSVAKCLGAKTVAQRALDCAREWPIISRVLEDVEAVKAIERFLDDERMLVEAACGAPLAFLYSGYFQQLQEEGHLSRPLDSVVLVVCGGTGIKMEILQAMKNQLGMV